MGEILIEDAIGYSRNTTALYTFDEVKNMVGIKTIANYLSKINLLDVDSSSFGSSYALGAFTYGVSPYNLASAYSMIPNKGYYQKGYTIKRITNSSTGKVLYTHNDNKEKVLSTSTCDILTEILKNVVNNNYYGLGSLKMDNNQVYVKSGTSSFDSNTATKYGYPSNASKDLWLAGFTEQYSFAIWTGFDTPKQGEKNYFSSGSDGRKSLHKKILSRILEVATTERGNVEITDSVSPVYIVKGTEELPNEYVPSSLITLAYFKKGKEPAKVLDIPSLNAITNIELLHIQNKLNISFVDYSIIDITKKENSIYSPSKVYGDLEYIVTINNQEYVSSTPDFEINLNPSLFYRFEGYVRYSKATDLKTNVYETSFTIF